MGFIARGVGTAGPVKDLLVKNYSKELRDKVKDAKNSIETLEGEVERNQLEQASLDKRLTYKKIEKAKASALMELPGKEARQWIAENVKLERELEELRREKLAMKEKARGFTVDRDAREEKAKDAISSMKGSVTA